MRYGNIRNKSVSTLPHRTRLPPTSGFRLDFVMALYALRDAAKLARPHTLGSALLLENESCIAIFDKYPKAKYHILILPRIPYFHTSSERQLDSLASVLQHNNAREIVSAMAEMATEVEEMIVDEMVKTEGFRWGVNVGFHAVPSMR